VTVLDGKQNNGYPPTIAGSLRKTALLCHPIAQQTRHSAAGCPTGIVQPWTFPHQLHAARGDGWSWTDWRRGLRDGQTVLDPATGITCLQFAMLAMGVCRTTASQQTPSNPSQVHLDPTKHYYISVLPGDAGNPFESGNTIGAMAWRSSDCLRASGAAANVYRFRYLPARHSAGGTNSFPPLETLRVCVPGRLPPTVSTMAVAE